MIITLYNVHRVYCVYLKVVKPTVVLNIMLCVNHPTNITLNTTCKSQSEPFK